MSLSLLLQLYTEKAKAAHSIKQFLLPAVTKLLRNAPGGGKIPLFRRAGAEN
jgi:hypothetical protein